MMLNFLEETVASVHKKLVKRELSVSELVLDSLNKIEVIDPEIGAFLSVLKEDAIQQAALLDQQGIAEDALYAGIPVGIKDNILVKGSYTTAASKILENFEAIYDATVIEKLKQGHMIPIGKLNMDEFAMGASTETSYFKLTKNPWDTTKVPGGSSGGSAASVASGEVLASLGSDTGGSIRQPAAFNGIVGMKPTYGSVSRYGLIAFGSSLDQIGPMTRTVYDNASLLNYLVGYDAKDSTSVGRSYIDATSKIGQPLTGMKIGVPVEYMGDGVHEDIKDAIKQAIRTYESLGAHVDEVSLPHSQYGIAVYYIIASSEASSNLQRFDGIRYGYRSPQAQTLEEVYVMSRSEGFGEEVKRRIMLGTFSLSSGYYDAFYKKAAQVRTLITEDFHKVFQDYDLILSPTTPTVAFNIGENMQDPLTMYASDILTIPVNLAGLPSMSLPCGFSNGLPIGMQLIGKAFDEATMYQAAYAFEQATPFHKQTPVVLGGAN